MTGNTLRTHEILRFFHVEGSNLHMGTINFPSVQPVHALSADPGVKASTMLDRASVRQRSVAVQQHNHLLGGLRSRAFSTSPALRATFLQIPRENGPSPAGARTKPVNIPRTRADNLASRSAARGSLGPMVAPCSPLQSYAEAEDEPPLGLGDRPTLTRLHRRARLLSMLGPIQGKNTGCPKLLRDHPSHYVEVYEFVARGQRVFLSTIGVLPAVFGLGIMFKPRTDFDNALGIPQEVAAWTFLILLALATVVVAALIRNKHQIAYVFYGLSSPTALLSISGLQSLFGEMR